MYIRLFIAASTVILHTEIVYDEVEAEARLKELQGE